MTNNKGGHCSIPSLLPTIQDRLLDCISAVLSKSHARSSIAMTRGSTTNATQQVVDLSGSALVQLALQTLAHFNFKVGILAFLALFLLIPCPYL